MQFQSHRVHRRQSSKHCNILRKYDQYESRDGESLSLGHGQVQFPPLTDERLAEQVFNDWVKNEGTTPTVASPMTLTPPDFANPNMSEISNAIRANTDVVQQLVQTIKTLTAALNLMKGKTVHKGTSMKAHNKKVVRYKNYVIKFLRGTKKGRATRGTLRRNLVKLESRFLSLVLKELVDNKTIEKKGQVYALVQNDD